MCKALSIVPDTWKGLNKLTLLLKRISVYSAAGSLFISFPTQPSPGWEPLLLFIKLHWKLLKVLVAQSCLTLWDPVDCSLPGSSIHGIFQVRGLEWGVFPFSRVRVLVLDPQLTAQYQEWHHHLQVVWSWLSESRSFGLSYFSCWENNMYQIGLLWISNGTVGMKVLSMVWRSGPAWWKRLWFRPVISQPRIYGPPLPLPHPTECQCDLLSLIFSVNLHLVEDCIMTSKIAKIFPGRKGP